jgi:hypothetical protein
MLYREGDYTFCTLCMCVECQIWRFTNSAQLEPKFKLFMCNALKLKSDVSGRILVSDWVVSIAKKNSIFKLDKDFYYFFILKMYVLISKNKKIRGT